MHPQNETQEETEKKTSPVVKRSWGPSSQTDSKVRDVWDCQPGMRSSSCEWGYAGVVEYQGQTLQRVLETPGAQFIL